MSFFDDLQVRVDQSKDDVLADVQSYFLKRTSSEFVKFLPKEAQGNLSAAEIAQGKSGQNPNSTIAPATAPAASLMNANQASQISGFFQSNYMPIVAVVAVGLIAYIALKKR